MELSSLAIVLGKRDIGETDRLYSFFTETRGKMVAVARGVRKPASKLAGHLETMNVASISIVRNRGRGNVASAVAEQIFPRIRSEEVSLRAAIEALSFVDRALEEDELDSVFFLLLTRFLRAIEMVSEISRTDAEEHARFSEKVFLLSQGFFWQALDHLGYGIETKVCASGGEALRPGERYVFSPDVGGVICGTHRHLARIQIPLGENAVKFFRILFSSRLVSLAKLSLDRETRRECERALSAFLVWIR